VGTVTDQQERADLGGCGQPPLSLPGLLVQPGVRDSGARRSGQRCHEFFVFAAELTGWVVGEVEVAKDLVTGPDRHAEEAVLGGVVGWETR
jgi:hypothetical protein